MGKSKKKQTMIVNLFGGAGCGKSTLAAGIFEALKMEHKNVEKVTEFIKPWTWIGRTPKWSDQMYILGNQIQSESILYGKVDVIITDSPIWLPAYYQEKFDKKTSMKIATQSIVKEIEDEGMKYVHFWLEKIENFQEEGRYQSKKEAHEIHEDLRHYLEEEIGLELLDIPVDHDTRKKIVIQKIKEIMGWN